MANDQPVFLTLTIPKEYSDMLRTMAAKHNLDNTEQVTTAAKLGKVIVCEYLDKLKVAEDE